MKTLSCSDTSGRNNNLTLLRFVAALAVIWGHSFPLVHTKHIDPVRALTFRHTYSGSIAVSAFFALSGFLVARSYYFNPNLAEWLKLRFARIYPGAIACLIVILVYVFITHGHGSGIDFFSSRGVREFFWHNAFLNDLRFGIGEDVFPGNRARQGLIGSWWTLPGEIRVYLLFAVLAVVGAVPYDGAKKPGFRRAVSVACLASLLGLSFYDYSAMPIVLKNPAYAFPTRCFLLGAIFFLVREYIPLDGRLCVLLLALPYVSYGSRVGFLTLSMFSITYAVFYFGYGLRDCQFEKVVGDWSYGIYIYGWFAQQIVAAHSPTQSPSTNFVFASALAIVLGMLSWKFVEKPALMIARRWELRDPRTWLGKVPYFQSS